VVYGIRYTATALEHLRGLSARDKRTLVDAVDDHLRHQPDVPTRRRKRMRPNAVAPWELRVGDYRVFYDVEPGAEEAEKPEVVVLAIGLKTRNRVWIGGEEHEL
jgi:mRNA-degrading endonuclease RelE of RelBE toxin-antitoxin system